MPGSKQNKSQVDKLDNQLKRATISKERQLIIVEKEKIKQEDQRLLTIKLEILRCLLLGEIIDEERTIPGCESTMKNLFEEGEIYTLKGKILELVKQL